jgi:hypothetical protein
MPLVDPLQSVCRLTFHSPGVFGGWLLELEPMPTNRGGPRRATERTLHNHLDVDEAVALQFTGSVHGQNPVRRTQVHGRRLLPRCGRGYSHLPTALR